MDYHINVFFSEKDNAYVADIPDLEVCAGTGPTPQAALEAALRAKETWLQAARDNGIPLPVPHYRPAFYAGLAEYRWD